MDDEFLLSKVTEIYPDFNRNNTENVLKQVILIIINDGRLISRLEKEYDLSPTEFLKILYRNYDFIFNKCFVTRVQKTVKNKKYAKRVAKRRARPFNRGCK